MVTHALYQFPMLHVAIVSSPTFYFYLKLNVAVSGEVEESDHDKRQVNPEVIAKHNSKRVPSSHGVIHLQRAPT